MREPPYRRLSCGLLIISINERNNFMYVIEANKNVLIEQAGEDDSAEHVASPALLVAQ